jgi:hypothetical protein
MTLLSLVVPWVEIAMPRFAQISINVYDTHQ